MKRCCVHVVAATTRHGGPRPSSRPPISQPHPPTPHASLDCTHFAECSGCTLQHDLDAPPALQLARDYFARHGVYNVPLSATHLLHGWRARARLAVRGRPGDVVIGLFKARSHDAVAIPACRAHHPLINDAVQLLKKHADALKLIPYNEKTKSGQLRYVQLTVTDGPSGECATDAQDHGGDGGRDGHVMPPDNNTHCDSAGQSDLHIQMVLVWNQPPPETKNTPHDPAIDALAASLLTDGDGQRMVNALWVNYQPSPNNVIMGPVSHLLWGPPTVWRTFNGAPVYLGPASFVQANTNAMQDALACMQRYVPHGAVLADLHAGVGTIALALAWSGTIRRAVCVEINPDVSTYFNAGVAALHTAWSTTHPTTTPPPTLRLHIGAAADAVVHGGVLDEDVDVVVVDPPRKGLEGGLLEVLCGQHGALPGSCQTLIYLSCGFAALQRDCDVLLASGVWELVHVETFLFFPGNDALETLVVLKRCTAP